LNKASKDPSELSLATCQEPKTQIKTKEIYLASQKHKTKQPQNKNKTNQREKPKKLASKPKYKKGDFIIFKLLNLFNTMHQHCLMYQ
jgi:hypothetical protein